MVANKDMYGYELVEAVSKIVDVKEGTIYPILKRLTNESYFETYTVDSKEGPIRKYYHLTVSGKIYKDKALKEWDKFSSEVNKFLKEKRNENE